MPTRHRMELGLYDARGHRKYLTTAERTAFVTAAEETPREVRTLCGLLVHTGCRLSEALGLTADRVDLRADLVVFETLKKRRSGVYRAVPVPHTLVDMLDLVHGLRPLQGRTDRGRSHRLWPWSRMTGWRRVCEVMARAGVRGPHASPKGLRHGFGVAAVTAGVPLNLVQKWLGHAQLSTTAIYADAVGEEEHAIAARMWCSQEQHHPAPLPPHGYEMPMKGHALHRRLLGSVEMRTSACWHHNPSRKCREERAMM
jgi:integrase/recombinase XerD